MSKFIMKSNWLIILILTFLLSCVKDEFSTEIISSSYNNSETKSNLDNNDNTNNAKFLVSDEDIVSYVHYLNTRNDCLDNKVESVQPYYHNGRVVYYLINLDSGWQILSADKRGPIVLAQNAEGDMSLESLNPAQSNWLDSMIDGIEYRWDHPEEYYSGEGKDIDDLELYCLNTWLAINADEDFVASNIQATKVGRPIYLYPPGHYELAYTYHTTETYNSVTHLMATRWHQGEPFNDYAPLKAESYTEHCPIGCVAVAAGQVLYYLHYQIGCPLASPTTGYCEGYENNYSMGFSNHSSETWDQMAYYSDPSGYAALLLGDLSVRLNMQFSSSGSSANMTNIKNPAFQAYGVDCTYLNSYNSDIVYQNLQVGLPVIFGGNRYENLFYWPGHAFVIDGYEDYVVTTHYVYSWVIDDGLSSPGGDVIMPVTPDDYEETITSTSPHLHCFYLNWGYGGDDLTQYATDGVWAYGDLTPYQYNREMVFGFSEYGQ